MSNIKKILTEKYKLLDREYKKLEKDKQELYESLKELSDAFENLENFSDDDLNDLRAMLRDKYKVKFDEIRKYFKVLKQFPNQSQIKKAKETLEEIKKDLIDSIIKERKVFFDTYELTKKKCNILLNFIDTLNNYKYDEYFDCSLLLNLIGVLKKSEITDDAIELFEKILLSNIKYIPSQIETNSINSKTIVENFSNYISRINKSLSNSSLENDRYLLSFYKSLLNKKLSKDITKDDIENIIKLTSLDSADAEELLKIEFIIHLAIVKIPFDDIQKSCIKEVVRYYEEKTDDIDNKQLYEANEKLILELKSEEIFSDIDLLNLVFKLNDTPYEERAKIICALIDLNVSKKENLKSLYKK